MVDRFEFKGYWIDYGVVRGVEQFSLFDCDHIDFDKYETVVQSTGLRDKNGKLIFESDVVKKGKNGPVGVIKMHHGCWMVFYKVSGDQYFNLHWYLDEVEVIGSIYEHKHLLDQ